jgi:EAL and modified HD-GYP domain-containing signal transduction protein
MPEPGAPAAFSGTAPALRYIARQPILNREQRTYGYELLSRSGPENLFRCTDPDAATIRTIDFSLLASASSLTAGLPAFINCTRNILLQDAITLLPRDRVIVEVLEDVPADPETMAACARLHRAGYRIALDDYLIDGPAAPMLAFADIVKVDFLATNVAQQARIAGEMRRRGIRLLAEKVELREQFELACRLGYELFQGYFFCTPQMVTMQEIPVSKLAHIQVLNAAYQEFYDVEELEQAILREPALCYRLLRYLNSAAFGLFPIRSIRHALSLLGQREIRKWVSIVVAIGVSSDRPSELIASTLARARTCEALAQDCRADASEAFMTGIMSLMDAILDRPMEALLTQLPLTKECKSALRGDASPLGRLLQLTVACERGLWAEVSRLATELKLNEERVWDSFVAARRWSNEILKEPKEPKTPI